MFLYLASCSSVQCSTHLTFSAWKSPFCPTRTVTSRTPAWSLTAWCAPDTRREERMLVRYISTQPRTTCCSVSMWETHIMGWMDGVNQRRPLIYPPLLRVILEDLWCVIGSCRASCLGARAALCLTTPAFTPESALWCHGSKPFWPATARLSSPITGLQERGEQTEIEIEGDKDRRRRWVVGGGRLKSTVGGVAETEPQGRNSREEQREMSLVRAQWIKSTILWRTSVCGCVCVLGAGDYEFSECFIQIQ